MAGLPASACTSPWQSVTWTFARFAPSKESNTSSGEVKENIGPQTVPQTSHYQMGKTVDFC